MYKWVDRCFCPTKKKPKFEKSDDGKPRVLILSLIIV